MGIRFLLIFLLFVYAVPDVGAVTHQKITAFMQTNQAKKLNPALQRRIFALLEENDMNQHLDLLLGFKTALTGFQRDQLQQEGVMLRSLIGTVATATAPAKAIPTIASLNFIENIELATPLQQRRGHDEKP